MQSFKELVKGEMVAYVVRRADHCELLDDKGAPDCLVQYDPESGIVTVDNRASDEYARWAGLHEVICCGKYSHLVPMDSNSLGRCARIEKLVMDIMPATYRVEYSRKRLEMFGAIIERGFSPEFRESFEISLAFHKEFLRRKGGEINEGGKIGVFC